MNSNQNQARHSRLRGKVSILESEETIVSFSSPFSKVNPFPEENSKDFYSIFGGLGSFEDRFPYEQAKSEPPKMGKEHEIFNNMKRQFELRLSNLKLEGIDNFRENPQDVNLQFFTHLMMPNGPNAQIKKQQQQIEELKRELDDVKSKSILDRKELEAKRRKLEEDKDSLQFDQKRRPRSSTEDEKELQRQLDVRWSSTERELQKRFSQMESLKNGLLEMQQNLRADQKELERKTQEQDEKSRQLDRLINPTQFIERERKLSSREKGLVRREEACKKREEQLQKREELIDTRNIELDRRLLKCKEMEEKIKESREKAHRTKKVEPSPSYGRQNLTEERARLFQKETMLLQKERALTQREQQIQDRESKSQNNVQKISQENLEAEVEEILNQKKLMDTQMEEILVEKKKLQDLRRLTHRAQVAFDRESSQERARLGTLEEKCVGILEKFGDHTDIVMKIQEQEEELARRGEEILGLYEDVQNEEMNLNNERAKLEQERLKFEHERTQILHRKPGIDHQNIAKMKEMRKELRKQVDSMKELKAQISHLIISEQIDWVAHPELREQVMRLTKVDPLDPPKSPSSSTKSRSPFDRTVKYTEPRRFSPQQPKKSRYSVHKVTNLRQNPLVGYE